MSCVIRAYSLIHYSFTRQLTLDKSVVLILYNGCDLANKYFMWKNPVIPSCKKIIKMSGFFHVQFCCQLKGFILNIDVDFLYIEISSISQTELKIWDVFFLSSKKLSMMLWKVMTGRERGRNLKQFRIFVSSVRVDISKPFLMSRTQPP